MGNRLAACIMTEETAEQRRARKAAEREANAKKLETEL